MSVRLGLSQINRATKSITGIREEPGWVAGSQRIRESRLELCGARAQGHRSERTGNSKKPPCPAILPRGAHREGLALQKQARVPMTGRATGQRGTGLHLPELVLGLRGKEGRQKGNRMCQTFPAPVTRSPSARG